MTEKTLYVPLCAYFWDNPELHGTISEIKADPSFGDGFFPAFNTLEEAEKHYPEAEIVTAYFTHKG
jgi:hypothetical protein